MKIIIQTDNDQLIALDVYDVEVHFKQEPRVSGQQGTRTILEPGAKSFELAGQLYSITYLESITEIRKFLSK